MTQGAYNRIGVPTLGGEDDHPPVLATTFRTRLILDLAITEVDGHERNCISECQRSMLTPVPMVPHGAPKSGVRGDPGSRDR